MMTAEETKPARLADFTEIPVALPPILMKMIGYPANARYVALYYMGSKSTWNDGRGLATFSYYSVYQPLIEHPVMAAHLFDAHLGSDDEYPKHALLCDRVERKFFVGDSAQVLRFVHQKHTGEQVDNEIIAEHEREIDEPTTAADFNRLGMFELFTAPDVGAQRDTALLRQWLDGYITEELLNKLLDMIQKHDLRAYMSLEYIRRLIEAAKDNACTGEVE